MRIKAGAIIETEDAYTVKHNGYRTKLRRPQEAGIDVSELSQYRRIIIEQPNESEMITEDDWKSVDDMDLPPRRGHTQFFRGILQARRCVRNKSFGAKCRGRGR